MASMSSPAVVATAPAVSAVDTSAAASSPSQPASVDAPNKRARTRTSSGTKAARAAAAANAASSSLPPATTSDADAESAAAEAKAADDFFARAQKMGLRLTREDFERTRAGVAAFLKADRAPGVGTTTAASIGMRAEEAVRQAASTEDSPMLQAGLQSSPEITSAPPRPRTAGAAAASRVAVPGTSPMLSFFSAVVPSSTELGSLSEPSRPRPKLDEVGSAEERKRRKAKRQRMKERLQDVTAVEPGTAAAASSATPDASSMMRGTSVATSVATPSMRSSSRPRGAPDSGTSGASERSGAGLLQPGAYGLGLVMEAPSTPSPHPGIARAFSAPPDSQSTSASLTHLNRLACVSPGGTLSLLARAAGSESASPASQAGNDDSGVWIAPGSQPLPSCADEAVGWSTAATAANGDAAQASAGHHRRLSSGGASAVNEGMDKLSFLDRIMAQKASPLRLRKEAKARERDAAGKDEQQQQQQAELADATEAQAMDVDPAPQQQEQQQQQSQAQQQQQQRRAEKSDAMDESEHGPLHSAGLKSVRWADFNSPHRRMTTREHYDLVYYGIAPGDVNANNAAAWDDAAMMGWQGNARDPNASAAAAAGAHMLKPTHPLNASPLASRMAQHFHGAAVEPPSPDILSLDLQVSEARMGALSGFSAKRGLLFGPASTSTGFTPPTSATGLTFPPSGAALANVLGGAGATSPSDLSMEQGPTLAKSPTRGFGPFSASPMKLVRAHTLAAPFTTGDRPGSGGGLSSPDRASFGGARSRSTEAALQLAARARRSQGWPNASSMDKYDTVSPAALFESSLMQSCFENNDGPLPEPTKRSALYQQQQSLAMHTPQLGAAGEDDADGDDEGDAWNSPELHVGGRGGLLRFDSPHGAGYMQQPALSNGTSRSASVDESSPELANQSMRRFAHPSSSLASALGVRPMGQMLKFEQPPRGKKDKAKQRAAAAAAGEEESQGDSGGEGRAGKGAKRDRKRAAVTPAQAQVGQSEWDKEDGSRVVKLVSEELQAAIDAGALEVEPPARYYKLPPGFGTVTTKPANVSYAGLIGQAILSSSDGRLSLNEVYNWISSVYPFYERGDRGWQNSIRHNLSLNKSFEKLEREANMPGKGGFWAIKAGHEDRFRGGVYVATGSEESAAAIASSSKAAKQPSAKSKSRSRATATAAAEDVTAAAATAITPASPPATHADGSAEEWGSSVPPAKPGALGAKPSPGTLRQSRDAARRKRLASNDSVPSEHASDSDYKPAAAGATSKRSKSGSSKKVRLARLDSPPPLGEVQQTASGSGSGASRYASVLPHDAITPSRPGMTPYASSGHGSTHTNAVPMLTDASSPPSSPILGMGVDMTAGGGGMLPPGAGAAPSARKRKLGGNAAAYNASQQFAGAGQQRSAGNAAYGEAGMLTYLGPQSGYSQHALQGSPLAGMHGRLRQNSANGNGNNNALNGNTFGSPLRRSSHPITVSNGDSPARLLNLNSPVSSVRGGGPRASAASSTGMERDHSTDSNSAAMTNGLFGKSPARGMGSPVRGSPLRPGGGALAVQGGREVRAVASPAGMHLQMAMDSSSSGLGTPGGMGFSVAGLSGGSGLTPNRPVSSGAGASGSTPGQSNLARWAAGYSPNLTRRFTPTVTPGRANAAGATGTGTPGWLDDPFDYGGALQHELDLAAMSGISSGIDTNASPMRVYAWSNAQGQAQHAMQTADGQDQAGLQSAFE